jgi:hypothetical protein
VPAGAASPTAANRRLTRSRPFADACSACTAASTNAGYADGFACGGNRARGDACRGESIVDDAVDDAVDDTIDEPVDNSPSTAAAQRRDEEREATTHLRDRMTVDAVELLLCSGGFRTTLTAASSSGVDARQHTATSRTPMPSSKSLLSTWNATGTFSVSSNARSVGVDWY